jgi:NADH:ubiquinone oxidoreductase subunit 3 (subunit A)
MSSNGIIFVISGVLILGVIIYEFFIGETVGSSRRRNSSYNRKTQPVQFWAMIVFQFVLAVGFMLFGVFGNQ